MGIAVGAGRPRGCAPHRTSPGQTRACWYIFSENPVWIWFDARLFMFAVATHVPFRYRGYRGRTVQQLDAAVGPVLFADVVRTFMEMTPEMPLDVCEPDVTF